MVMLWLCMVGGGYVYIILSDIFIARNFVNYISDRFRAYICGQCMVTCSTDVFNNIFRWTFLYSPLFPGVVT